MPGVASYVVEPGDGELTKLVSRIEIRPSGLARLAEPLMAAAMRRDVVANLATLKTLLEAESRQEAPSEEPPQSTGGTRGKPGVTGDS